MGSGRSRRLILQGDYSEATRLWKTFRYRSALATIWTTSGSPT